MEIERKYLIDKNKIPFQPSDFPCRRIEQGYLCTEPVVRVRRDQDDYILTYKSKGLMAREEYNLPLTKEAYLHLREKTDGNILHLFQNLNYLLYLSDQHWCGGLVLKMCIRDSNHTMDTFGRDYDIFVSNSIYQNAVALCVLQIGELTTHFTDII